MALINIDVYSKRLIRLLFDDEVVVNATYNDPANYIIQNLTNPGFVDIVQVLPVNKNTALEVILVTQPMVFNTTYVITAISLSDRSGFSSLYFGNFIARDTKIDSILRSIPKHLDKRTNSLLHSVLVAIGRSDDIIGGSRKDSIEYV